jgi:hypothetical protein
VAWAFSTTTHYCQESTGGEADVLNSECPDGIEEKWPDDICTLASGTELCKCSEQDVVGESCHIDKIVSSAKSGRCKDVVVKVTTSPPLLPMKSDDEDIQNVVAENIGIGGIQDEYPTEVTKEIFCKNMVVNDDWAEYTRSRAPEETDADFKDGCGWECASGWFSWVCTWWCWESWRCSASSTETWDDENRKCYDNDRYIGEYCSGDLNCKGSGAQYDEYSTSCLDSECVAYAEARAAERKPCTCNWFDVYVFFACASDACDGHACVLSTGGGGGYWCDMATEQATDWLFGQCGPLAWFGIGSCER